MCCIKKKWDIKTIWNKNLKTEKPKEFFMKSCVYVSYYIIYCYMCIAFMPKTILHM